MTLSSQSPRNDGSIRGNSSRGGSLWRPVALLGLVALVGGFVIWLIVSKPSTPSTDANDATQQNYGDGQSPNDPAAAAPAQPADNTASSGSAVQDPQTGTDQFARIQDSDQSNTPNASRLYDPPVPSHNTPMSLGVREQLNLGVQHCMSGDPALMLRGRRELSALLIQPTEPVPFEARRQAREMLDQVNQQLVFSGTPLPGDPTMTSYTIVAGDNALTQVTRRHFGEWFMTARALGYINGFNPDMIRLGQTLRIVKGPIHARVSKSEFVMDLFVNEPGTDTPVYIASFPVGLGSDDSTPVGEWVIGEGKDANPSWINPRTRESYGRDDPDNPIGERWLPLIGIDENTRQAQSYGIHGTIEPDTIGTNASLGCIRMHDEDVRVVYDLLVSEHSHVFIVR